MISIKKQIDRQSLAKYLFYGFIPAPATIFKGLKKPLRKDWQLDYSKKTSLSPGKIKLEVLRLLKQAIKQCLNSDMPVGVLLSGGIDSGLVAALMKEFIPSSSICAFSLGFEEKEADESKYARLVAKHLGLKHHLKIFSSKEALKVVQKLGNILDEPMADPSILPTYFLFSFAEKRVKLAFLGDGGDEAFAGYPKYLAHWFLAKTHLDKLPLSFLARIFSGKLESFFRYASYPLHLRNQLWINPFSQEEVKELTGQEVNFDDLERYHQLFNGQDPLNEAFFLDQKLTLPDLYLVKTERASQATDLKIRCPFLDKKLSEFCVQIPFGIKLKNLKTKGLLREIALDYLPKEIINRPKQGFGLPLKKWISEDLRFLIKKELSPQKIKKEGFLNHQKIKEILKRDDPHQIWTLLVFELWLKKRLKN